MGWPCPNSLRRHNPRQCPVEWEGSLLGQEGIGTNGSLPKDEQTGRSLTGGKERTPRCITYASVHGLYMAVVQKENKDCKSESAGEG